MGSRAMLPPLSLTDSSCPSHFATESAEAQKGKAPCPGHAVSSQRPVHVPLQRAGLSPALFVHPQGQELIACETVPL